MKRLALNAVHDFFVDARNPCNQSGVLVEEGHRYIVKVEMLEPWVDWFIKSSPERGWQGLARSIEPFARRHARTRQFPMYALVGAIDDDESTFFLLPSNEHWLAPKAGQLTCFANDYPHKYHNNRGRHIVSLRRTA